MNGKLVRNEETTSIIWRHERGVGDYSGDPEPCGPGAFKRLNRKKVARSLADLRTGVAGQLIHGGR